MTDLLIYFHSNSIYFHSKFGMTKGYTRIWSLDQRFWRHWVDERNLTSRSAFTKVRQWTKYPGFIKCISSVILVEDAIIYYSYLCLLWFIIYTMVLFTYIYPSYYSLDLCLRVPLPGPWLQFPRLQGTSSWLERRSMNFMITLMALGYQRYGIRTYIYICVIKYIYIYVIVYM